MSSLKYHRVLLKLSGEVLAGESGGGIDFSVAERICAEVVSCVRAGAELALVVGGGNFWRGRTGGRMDAVRADQMGMLATVMNAIALADTLEQLGVGTLVQCSLFLPQVVSPISKPAALAALAEGKVVLFGGGTGNPFFTTDSTAALRAAEIEADVVLKATNVDGVYDKDPRRYPSAVKFDVLTHDDILTRRLRVMDSTAASLCRDNGIPMLVFNLSDPSHISRAIRGESVGTLITDAPAS
ncbi:MAG: UMP kinase [Oscillospiraceae bacterium]|jgi:uridylate kinase|nr:UMP kinase [Oscillospiraceae bacterium]